MKSYVELMPILYAHYSLKGKILFFYLGRRIGWKTKEEDEVIKYLKVINESLKKGKLL